MAVVKFGGAVVVVRFIGASQPRSLRRFPNADAVTRTVDAMTAVSNRDATALRRAVNRDGTGTANAVAAAASRRRCGTL